MDKSPWEIYATLLDEGTYLCSVRTMYRLLARYGQIQERTDVLTHDAHFIQFSSDSYRFRDSLRAKPQDPALCAGLA